MPNTYKFAAAAMFALVSLTGQAVAAPTTKASAILQQSVSLASVSESLAVTPASVALGQAVSLKATVTGLSPSGSVTFYDGSTAIGSAHLSAGVATLPATFTTVGSHAISFGYSGDSANAAASSKATTLPVAAATATLKLASSAATTQIQQAITLTATATGYSPTGTVTFKDGTAILGTGALSNGVATLQVKFTTAGSHSLTASYAGDTQNAASTATALNLTVGVGRTSTALTTSTGTPVVNASVTLSATVVGSKPTGTVSFLDGTTVVGSAALTATGTASFAVKWAKAGNHQVTAAYAGDSNNGPSASAGLAEAVAPASVTQSLAVTPVTAVVGQAVNLKATITGLSPTGSVSFYDGSNTLGSASLVSGAATFSAMFTTAGTHNLSSVYAGDAANATSTSKVSTLPVSAAADTLTLTSSATTAAAQQAVTLKATATGYSPTGTVTFKDGTAVLGTGTLSNGVATLQAKFATAGAHSLSAAYAGDAQNAAATSTALSVAVTLNTTSTTLTSNSGTATLAAPVTLTAAVSGNSPSGTVTFKDGTATLGTATLASGVATYTATFTATGAHALSAAYAGDSANSASTSAALTESVATAAATIALTSSASQVNVSSPVTLKAIVTGANPTGTVAFKDGTATLGTATLTAGVGSLTATFASTGTHSLSAVYSGDKSNNAATSSTLAETVGTATSTVTLSSASSTTKSGQPVVLTAKVATGNSAGTVQFYDGIFSLGTASVANGVATYSAALVSVGNHRLVATYSGNTGTTGSTSPAVEVAVTRATPVVTLSTAATSVALGAPVTVTVTVTGSSPTGTVGISDGVLGLSGGSLTNGSVSQVVYLSSPGVHNITANYGGDANNASTKSAAATITVGSAATALVLNATSNITIGQGESVIATVTPSTLTGKVTFLANGVPVAAGTLNGKSGTTGAFYSPTIPGTYTLTATFAGTPAMTSNSVTLTVSGNSVKPPPSGNGIKYNNGPIMNQGANIYYIWYGTWDGAAAPTILDNFAKGVGGSSYFHINTTYLDNGQTSVQDQVTYMGQVSDSYSQGKSLNDNAVMNIVNGALSTGALPTDPNGVYFVMTSKDVDETSGLCQSYCGWHSYYKLPNGQPIKFAFIGSPERCASACEAPSLATAAPNGDREGDAMASVVAHELAETVTDPFMNGWVNPDGNENGDLCEWKFAGAQTVGGKTFNLTLPTGQFYVQNIWLNARGGSCAQAYP